MVEHMLELQAHFGVGKENSLPIRENQCVTRVFMCFMTLVISSVLNDLISYYNFDFFCLWL